MYLDESILQSRTTLSLVEFIDELYSCISFEDLPAELRDKYLEVKKKANKASKKRSFK